MTKSSIDNLEVLFEDNHIIAINKRSSDLVQGDKTGDDPLSEIVKAWLKKKYQKPGNVFCGVVHRIDRPVSGVVVFAKTGKALSRLSSLFKSKEVNKTYWAAVCNPPPKQRDEVIHFLKKNQGKNKSYPTDEAAEGAKKASLSYTYLKASDRYHLLEVNPKTGRHHQIRVQLASIGCPIKGDLKYGAPRSNRDGSIHLHAYRIEFIHPVRNEPVSIQAPLPSDPVWNAFLA